MVGTSKPWRGASMGASVEKKVPGMPPMVLCDAGSEIEVAKTVNGAKDSQS